MMMALDGAPRSAAATCIARSGGIVKARRDHNLLATRRNASERGDCSKRGNSSKRRNRDLFVKGRGSAEA